jgi:hypothetical protein
MSKLPADLPQEFEPLYTRYLEQPTFSREQLKTSVESYLQTLERLAGENEHVDLTLARSIGSGLLDLLANVSDDHLDHVHAAAGYFTSNEDVLADLESIAGFDDDAQVFNAVCAHLGRKDLEVV